MKSKTPETSCDEGVFQIQSPVCGVDFSNNIVLPKVRINDRETEFGLIFENSQPLTSRINPSIIL